MSLNLYHALGQINKIKRKELVLPIARKEVVVSPLSVGDDLILKTSLLSPAKLDKELIRLLWMHTEFWVPNNNPPVTVEPEIEKTEDGIVMPQKRGRKRKPLQDNTAGNYKKIPEREFYNQISYFDKLVLLWGIYNVTYGSLGTQEITCSECGETFPNEVYLDDTLHEDSLTLFENEEVPFNKYTESIIIPLSDEYSLDFTVCIPSMADFNRILGLVSTAELQANLENIRSQFNTEQLMTLYTKRLAVFKTASPAERSESAISQEILSSIRDFLNIDISQKFFNQYAEKFSKYAVNFYSNCECPNCKTVNKQGVDIEFEFFRRQLPS